jgi:opacity protein-like surface antigen
MRQMTTLVFTAMLVTGATAGLRAQAPGIPVYNSGVAGGLALAAELGVPNGAAGGGIAYGASARLGAGPFGVTAMGIRSDPSGDADNTLGVGATINYKVLGGPLIPLSVTLQGGAGYSRNTFIAVPSGATSHITHLRFPIGLGIAMSLPNPVLAIKPWLAPRIDIVRVSGDGTSATSTAFAISGGIEFNLLSGLGLHTGYDWSRRDGITFGTFGVGLHYAMRVPGL